METTILEERKECRIGHIGSVLVMVWYSEPTVPALEAFEGHHRALSAKYGKITMLSVLIGGTGSPPAEVRARIDAHTAELQKLRHGMIVVVLARGLAAIFIRTFLAALALVSSEHMRVVKTVEEAALEVTRVPGQDELTRSNPGLAGQLAAFVDLPRPAV